MLDNKKIKIAMYGGSFNPVHRGHIQLVELFIQQLKLDKVLIVPTATPPHKSDREMVSATHRINMCELAFEHISKVNVSDIEILRKGKSYTVDTLRELIQLYPKGELYLLMGADMFLSLDTWRQYKEILKMTTVCTLPRNLSGFKELTQYADYLKSVGGKALVINQPVMQVSSTEIRQAIKSKTGVAQMIPPCVEKYIYDNQLYRE
ncbi:MAG TPA: nicotinate (nicotinamide) nucleotide adenylyltransferase [Clostridiales bacterium]|nr:nicotinate (nicotinamide) nucleotide adenylyltransferase [Clostridiales bacterium]